jgi:hypothetical protein
MDKSTEILATLQQVLKPGSAIRLLNLYKGVPISHAAQVIEISPQLLRARVEKIQLACLYRDKEAYLQSDSLMETYKAKAVELDLKQIEAIFTVFEEGPPHLGERAQVRVEPNEPITGQVEIGDDRRILFGELADISQNGLAIVFSKEQSTLGYFVNGRRVTVTIHLPGMFDTGGHSPGVPASNVEKPMQRYDRETLRMLPRSINLSERASAPQINTGRLEHSPRLRIQGTVAYAATPIGQTNYRLGIQILPTDPARQVIAQFISQRQSEIIREIRAISELMER